MAKRLTTAPTDFYELFGEQKELAKQEMFNGYQLIDLSQMADEELATHRKASLVEWFMKHVHDRDFMALQQILIAFLHNHYKVVTTITTQDEDHLLSISYYLLSEANIALEIQGRFLAIMKNNLSQAVGEKTVSLAYQIEQRGIQQGRQEGLIEGVLQGMEKGRFEGILEGERKAFTRRLQRRFKLPQHHLNLINVADETAIARWDSNLDEATDLDDIFTIIK